MDAFIELVKIFGLPGAILASIVWAFYANKVYTKKAYEDMVAQRNELWEIVKPSLKVAEQALTKVDEENRRRSTR